MDSLPSEIINTILGHLKITHRISIERTCKIFRVLSVNFHPGIESVFPFKGSSLSLVDTSPVLSVPLLESDPMETWPSENVPGISSPSDKDP